MRFMKRTCHCHNALQGFRGHEVIGPLIVRMAAAGAFFSGLIAVGTFAAGRAILGFLFIRKAKIDSLDIDELSIHRLRIDKRL